MSEEHLDSVKLELEEKEREKVNSEVVESKSSENMARGEQNLNDPQDGADEKMLGSDDKSTLALKDIEVKFISGDKNTNGDAKIDIGNIDKQAFAGMTKEELMKYANDPFWVRLRWILFVLFWAIWVGMLVGAISIIVFAPKCSAPSPLVWWKEGPIVAIKGDESAEKIKEIADYKPKAVIYQLPADDTYLVDTPAIKERIEKLVESYKTNEIHVVLELTPNIVKKESDFYTSASSNQDWKNFITTTGVANNWKKVDRGDDSAWEKIGNKLILNQFNGYYDLNMESSDVQDRIIGVIQNLVGLGVKGFRFNNAKFFLVNHTFADEAMNSNAGAHGTDKAVGQYGFYHHHQTTYVNGLGNLLHKFTKAVHNATNGEGFLTIRDDFANNVEVFKIDGTNVFGLDIPKLNFINKNFKKSAESAMFLKTGFELVSSSGFNIANSRIQIPFNSDDMFKDNNIGYAAYKIFASLLPGVQIASIEDFKKGADPRVDKILQEARESPVFQHGAFDYLISANKTSFGYTRVKAGNPGYFVAVNPTDAPVKANFTDIKLGSELSTLVSSFDDDDNKQKGKISVESVALPAQSAAIFTFVPNA